MSRRVFREELDQNPYVQPLKIPRESQILRVEATRDTVEFWFEIDDEWEFAERYFVIVGTGHEIPEGAIYRGTAARTPDGFVWHIYETPEGA